MNIFKIVGTIAMLILWVIIVIHLFPWIDALVHSYFMAGISAAVFAGVLVGGPLLLAYLADSNNVPTEEPEETEEQK